MSHFIVALAALAAVSAQTPATAQTPQATLAAATVTSRAAPTDQDGFIPPLRGTPDGRLSGASRGARNQTLAAPVDDVAGKPKPNAAHPRSIVAKPAETVQH